MKTLIVVTDYSESAETALKYAVLLARCTKASIALLHQYSFDIHALNGLISPAAVSEVNTKNQQKMDSYAEQQSSKYQVKLKGYVSTDVLEDALQTLAISLSAGMIVTGRHSSAGTSGFADSHIAGLACRLKVPVLIVPEDTDIALPRTILYACDYHGLPNEHHLEELTELVMSCNATLEVFHVRDHQPADAELVLEETVKGDLEESIRLTKHDYIDRAADGFNTGLQEGISELKPELLVMSPHRYGFWVSLFHKSRTKDVALHSSIPLLALPG